MIVSDGLSDCDCSWSGFRAPTCQLTLGTQLGVCQDRHPPTLAPMSTHTPCTDESSGAALPQSLLLGGLLGFTNASRGSTAEMPLMSPFLLCCTPERSDPRLALPPALARLSERKLWVVSVEEKYKMIKFA